MLGDPTDDRFPALRGLRRHIDGAVDKARRVLWRAFQLGAVNEEEFASILDRLEFGSELADPSPDQHRPAKGTGGAV
jgi:hypothetical protein